MEKKADEVLDMKKFDFTSYKKLVVFGDSKVGKSCLLQRLENDIFLEEKENDCNLF
ncbi:MAG: hypothetical protein MJ252_23965 [archaeon]|nr:hypothetical protein [archaeon]